MHKLNTIKGRRGFTVVWDPNVQTEKRPNIVYHPNGYLPRKLSEFASTQLVFLEDSFEDQLVDSFVSGCVECFPSEKWLGQFSPVDKIKKSGLWQVKELYSCPLNEDEFAFVSDSLIRNSEWGK